MLFSEAEGRKVVSTTTAETVGRIHDCVIDPQGPRLAALLLKKTDQGDTLRWDDILAFGADAVTVESADKLVEDAEDLAPLREKRNHLHKKRVLSTVGDELGSVKDFDFDPSTGTVTTLVLDGRSEIPGSRLVGVGSYAVVVETESAPAASGPPAPPQADGGQPSAGPTSLDLTPPTDPSGPPTLEPPDLSQAQRASYPPAE